MCALVQITPTPGNTTTPSCGFPQKSFPPEGPHDFRGHLRRSRKSDIAAEAVCLGRLCHLPPCAPPEGRTAGARLRTLGAPLGTHILAACCGSRSERTPVVSKNAPKECIAPLERLLPIPISQLGTGRTRTRFDKGIFGAPAKYRRRVQRTEDTSWG